MVALCPDKEALVLENRGLVGCVLKRLNTSPEDWDEFQAIGTLGLVLAAQFYVPSRGTKFSTYAYITIRNHVISEIRKRASDRICYDAESVPDIPQTEANGRELKFSELEKLLGRLSRSARLEAERLFGLNGRTVRVDYWILYARRQKMISRLRKLAAL